MQYVNERRIKLGIIISTLILHILILYTLFVLTRKTDYEPLHITLKQPPIIEYLLQSHAQQQYPLVAKTLAAIPPIPPSPGQQMQPTQQEPDEDGAEQYLLKNAISYGSYNQGSIVSMGQEGDGNGNTQKQADTEEAPEPEQPQEIGNTHEIPAQQESSEQTNLPDQSAVNPLTGMTPELAQAEEFLDNAGSSWITQNTQQPSTNPPSKTPTPAQAAVQPHTNPARTTPFKQLNIADITRGYLKQVRKEKETTGNYTYNPTGGSNGTIRYGVNAPPTDGAALSEQIYASKLYNLLEQSAQAYSNQIYSCKDLEMETLIEVTIEKSGKILDVKLNPELPEKDMERALCLIVNRVGLFPPIPRQFRKQRIVLSIPIHIKSKQGFASYRLLYGLHTT